MRAIAQVGVVTVLAIAAVATPRGQAGDPAKILAAARQALGGEKRLSGVKTFVATGRTRQVRGDNLVPIEFEISVELPDKYIRKDEIPAQENGPMIVGLSGDHLIQFPPQATPPTRAGGPPAPTAEQLERARVARAAGVKQDFARLALGMFAQAFIAYPLTFSYAGQAEAPQGTADVLDAKATTDANVAMRFFVYRDTHVPIMVSWQGAPQGSSPGIARGPAPAPPVENRVYFADYRDVDGMRFPFRLRRAVGTDTVEEIVFDRFRINPKIDAKKFEVPK